METVKLPETVEETHQFELKSLLVFVHKYFIWNYSLQLSLLHESSLSLTFPQKSDFNIIIQTFLY